MQKTKVILLVVVSYILMQFCWWAFMLTELNNEVFKYKHAVIRMHFQSEQAIKMADSELNRWLSLKFLMIAGEGFVFISLLIFGIVKLMKSYNKEMELARQQKNFLLSITHEFKSPLAVVKLNMQTMQKHNLDQDLQRMMIRATLKETNRLNNLVENALMAAQIETHTYTITKNYFDLSKCILSNLEARSLSSEKIKNINVAIENDVFLLGDCISFSSIILNLLENAEKYTGDDAQIALTLKKKNKEVWLTISDNGYGIADDEKPKVFEKFYRIGNEDTRKSKGTGLGLFIVKQLVTLHHGKITILNNVPKGTIFQMVFAVKSTD